MHLHALYIVTVILSTGVECEEGEVCLVGGVSNSSGRLEVCANGMWGRVCNALQYWGPDNARVVCRQLGVSKEGKTFLTLIHNMDCSACLLGASVVSSNIFGDGSRPFVVGEVHCTGTEAQVLECSHNGIGDHLCGGSMEDVDDVAIVCHSGTFL